ncbi:MAG TPA: TolC family protein [Terriglobales bacterium]|nr:TolC family protein [Terriglobales bacterium]
MRTILTRKLFSQIGWMRPPSRWKSLCVFGLILTFRVSFAEDAQKLTLKHAVELALQHSPVAAQAVADEERALNSYREMRSNFIPQLTVGSGLGATWGYPLSLEGSAPSIVNLNGQSAIFNPQLRDAIRAARLEYAAAQYNTKDRRSQIIQDTALAYLELVKWERNIDGIRQQHHDSLSMEQVAQQRVDAGVDRPQMRTEAKLAVARANLHVIQAENSVHSLRMFLSQLTGLEAASIQVDPDSVPAFPDVPSDPDTATKVAEASPLVSEAQKHALAQEFRARAEHRGLWPSIDFATQYAMLARYNNWDQFFVSRAFQRNNASIGVVIRFPFFNAPQRAHAAVADGDAVKARAEVQNAKNQVSQEVLKLQGSARQLAAAKEVSQLEYDLAQSNFNEIEVRTTSGGATIHDRANASAEISEKFNQLQDADFELSRARLALLRMTGVLASWVGVSK